MTLSEMWPDPRLAKGVVQGGYLLEIEHPKTANAIVESFATISSAVTRASELIKRAIALRFGLLCLPEAHRTCSPVRSAMA
jgi:hypothetical protein